MALKRILPEDRYVYTDEYLSKVVFSNGSDMKHEPSMWLTLVETVIVCTDQKLQFKFVDGNEIILDIPERKKHCPVLEDDSSAIPGDASQRENETTAEGEQDMETAETKERHRLSEIDKRKIMELKVKGFGYRHIAKQLQLNQDSVKSFIRRHGNDPKYVTSLGLCMHCGSPLVQTPGKKAKKFCSDACRMKWWAEHSEQLDRTMHTNKCAYCGQDFQTVRKSQQFCCRACYAGARRKDTSLQ